MFAFIKQLFSALSSFAQAAENLGNATAEITKAGQNHAEAFRLESEKATEQARQELHALIAQGKPQQ